MLTVQNTEAIRRIEEAIGYTFHDKRLLVQVLTRKTYLKIDPEAPDNEVLEFYGDTLMNYHVTNYFMSKYAHMLDDGLFFMRTVEQFTDMRSHYVCNRYLTDRVKALGLARYLRAQNRDSELRRDGEKAYADIFESLVGAIYLDSYQNDMLIRAFILRQLGIEPKRPPEDIEAFDYDSLVVSIPEDISEEMPDAAFETAETAETDETAAEMPVSEMSIEDEVPAEPVDSIVMTATEEAPSLPEIASPSETVEVTPAAEKPAPAPVREAVSAEIPAEEPVPSPMQEALAELCRRLGYDQPTYSETPKNAPNARPVAACTMKYKDAKGKLVKISLNDSGKTLAEATEKAAAKMLKKLEKQASEPARKEPKAAKAPKENPQKPAEPIAEPVADVTEAVAEVTPDMISEVTSDTTPDMIPEVTLDMIPEVTPEMVPEVTPDMIPEVTSDTIPEVTSDMIPEVTPDMIPEVIPDAAPVAAEPVIEEQMTVDDMLPTVEASAAPVTEAAVSESTPAVGTESAEEPKPARAPRKRKADPGNPASLASPANAEDKPARKSTPRKKAAPKTETSAEEGSAAATEEPAETQPKPRTRKPRAKKPVSEAVETANPAEAVETAPPAETAEAVEPAVPAVSETPDAPVSESEA